MTSLRAPERSSAGSGPSYCAGAVVPVPVAGVVVVVDGAVVLIEPVLGSVVVVDVVAGAVVVVVAAGVSVLLSEQADRARRAEAQIAKEIFFIVSFHPFVGFGAQTHETPRRSVSHHHASFQCVTIRSQP
jgi:hypothetical protein